MKNILKINKTISRQINLWFWLFSILPLTTLTGLWVAWMFGSQSTMTLIMMIGGIVILVTAIAWGWWAIKIIRHLVTNWERAETGITDISKDLKEIRILVKKVILLDRDK